MLYLSFCVVLVLVMISKMWFRLRNVVFAKWGLQITNSISSLKNTEETRNLTFLKNILKKTVGNDVQSMVIRKAYNLSKDLDHEEEEESMDHLDPGTTIVKNTSKRGTKKGVGLSVQRRSARIEKLRKNSQ